MYWAMRTSRDSVDHREFLKRELAEGRLRQGWGWCEEQDLRLIEKAWEEGQPLTKEQVDASRHWRMGDGPPGDYMNEGDVVLVPNMPHDGLFTLVRISGPYAYEVDGELVDFGHLRPVDVLTPIGVANQHPLVEGGLRRSLRYPGRLWRIPKYSACLERIIGFTGPPRSLAVGATALGRAESIVSDLVAGPVTALAQQLSVRLPLGLEGSEWETVVGRAVEPLFPVTVRHTGGPLERGADLEIMIANPFDQDRNWIVPVQIKDHTYLEGPEVGNELGDAFRSRVDDGHVVIAVVLLVTDADPSPDLTERMLQLSEQHHVPFIYCGSSDFMEVLARGFLKQI